MDQQHVEILNLVAENQPKWDNLKPVLKEYLTVHPKDYHFLRYLVSIVEDADLTKDVRYSIASWMFTTNRTNYPFSDIFVVDDIVYICTVRPGLWIGKGGETVDNLTNNLNTKVDGTKYRNLRVQFIESINDAASDVYGYIQTLDRFRDDCINN